MCDVLQNYINFFRDQIDESVAAYEDTLRSPVRQLIDNGKAVYAVVHGVSESRGHIILRISKKHALRLKVQRSFVLIKKVAREAFGESPESWACSFREFMEKLENHSSSSYVLPLYTLQGSNPQCTYIGCGGVSAKMFHKIKGMLAKGVTIRLLVYETEPPTRYLANLADYIERNDDDENLLLRPQMSYDQWKPELLAYDAKDQFAIPGRLLDALRENGTVVLQGPPGTGKSFCAAHVIANYLSRGKSVGVTAMANKALMELIQQAPLQTHLEKGRLLKAMMTSDEARQAKGLKDADAEGGIPKGEALFATYYKFSRQFRSLEKGIHRPLYDLVVVEEASQAYLTTLAAARRLGAECLIVGDPMQLSPIVEKENKAEYKRWNVALQAEGLSSLALGSPVKSFRITTTFRLTTEAARLTGIFYGDTLRSVALKSADWSGIDAHFFLKGGGTRVELLTGGEDGVLSAAAESAMAMAVAKLRMAKKMASLAIVTPFKDTVKAIQNSAKIDFGELDVSVETIDRVQGATVDYAIIYLPLRNVGFAFEPKRFNVATSRSRTTTLILSDYDPLAMGSVTGKVRQYLMQVMRPDQHEYDFAAASEKTASLGSNRIVDPLMPAVLEVRQKMDVVQARLGQWLDGWLTIVYPSDVWKNAVAKNLSEIQYQNARQRGIRKIIDLDLNALLSVFLGNFRDLQSVSHMEDEMQSLAHLVRNIRHDYSHIRTRSLVTPKIQQTQYHLDNLSQFLDGLDATAPEAKSIAAPKTIVKKAGMTIAVS